MPSNDRPQSAREAAAAAIMRLYYAADDGIAEFTCDDVLRRIKDAYAPVIAAMQLQIDERDQRILEITDTLRRTEKHLTDLLNKNERRAEP